MPLLTFLPSKTPAKVIHSSPLADGNIRYYEYEADNLHFLSEFGDKAPQRGMTFLPRRSLDVSENEVARGFKISGSTVEALAFIVPRKAENFQA